MPPNAPSGSTSTTVTSTDARPNVLLIVVDALRADYTAPYAAPRATPDDASRDAETSAPADAPAETPAIRSLAEAGTVFSRAISPAPWTLPSVTSLLTGLDPHEHGATARGFGLQRGRPLQQQLSGYRRVHVSPTTWIGEWLPQGRGFDQVTEFTGPTHRYLDRGADVRRLSAGVARGPEWYATVLKRALRSDAPLASLANAAAFKLTEARGDHWLDRRASDRAADAVEAHLADAAERRSASPRPRAGEDADEPWFLYVHLMDPHLPLYVPEAFRSAVRPPGCATAAEEREYLESLLSDVWAIRLGERRLSRGEREYLRTRYRDAVAYVDSVIGGMLDALDRYGRRENTLVALTADHGEHLGEPVDGRTLVDHQTSVRLPVLRVPLVVRYPGTFDGGRRDDLVQPHYLAETIRATAGLEHDPARSLLPADADARRDVAVAGYAGVVRSHPPEEFADADRLFVSRRTAVRGDWKLDAVGDRRRAARVDWDANEARPVPVADVPPGVRRELEAALPRPPGEEAAGVEDAGDAANEGADDAGGGADDAADGDAGTPEDGTASERDLPEDVAARLEELGYR